MTPDEHDAGFMRSVLAASEDCIKIIGLDGTLAYMSEGGQRTMEVSDFNAIKGCPWPSFWEGQGKLDALAAIEAARSGESARFQGPANTAAGNPRFWDVQVSPILGPDGGVEGILSVSRDITMLKQAEDQQRLLSQELKHRMKNTLAMIQAIANQTIRGSEEADGLRETFGQRLRAMGEAQDLLSQQAWATVELAEVARTALKAHDDGRFEITGPAVQLSSRCAVALTMALHELATNALKYGALSEDDGRVALNWEVAAGNFHLRWREAGGPPVIPPSRRGFGSLMIEQVLADYFSGVAAVLYESPGVLFELEAPVAGLTAE